MDGDLSIYSSSPTKTRIGIHASPTTFALVVIPLISLNSFSVRFHPSRAKLFSIRAGVMLFGIMLTPLWSPHINLFHQYRGVHRENRRLTYRI